MRKLLSVWILLASLFCSPAFAALAVTKGPADVQGNPPAGITLGSSVGIGQVIYAIVQGGTLPGSAVVTDNVNSGSYSLLQGYSAGNLAIYWKITNASGTPTVSIATTGGYCYLTIGAITGFAGTPTADTTFGTTTATGTGTTAAISATSNFNNEVLLVGYFQANNYADPITVSGWTATTTSGGTTQPGFYAIEATAGTANTFSGTFSPSQQWWLTLGGIYDPGSGTAAPTNGGFVISADAANDPRMPMDRLILPRFKRAA